MSTKKSTLNSSLIMTKGQTKTSTPAAPKPKAKADEEAQPLNFKVAADFRREFRLMAAQEDIKLIDLLYASFEAYKREKGFEQFD